MIIKKQAAWMSMIKRRHHVRNGYVGMPYLRAQPDTCTMNKIPDWIAQGAPNN